MNRPLKAITLNPSQLNIIVFGVGRIGSRKAKAYAKLGARLTLVDPDLKNTLEGLETATYYPLTGEAFLESHGELLKTMHLCIIATPSKNTNHALQMACEASALLFNRVDAPDQSYFSDMSQYQDDNYLFAASGNTKSPYVAKFIIEKVKAFLSQESHQNDIKALASQTPELKAQHKTYESLDMNHMRKDTSWKK